MTAPAAIRSEDGLTSAEGKVMDHLVAAVEAFAKLPRQHPQEINDFVDAIHVQQGLLAIRIARRHYPAGWPEKVNRTPGKSSAALGRAAPGTGSGEA